MSSPLCSPPPVKPQPLMVANLHRQHRTVQVEKHHQEMLSQAALTLLSMVKLLTRLVHLLSRPQILLMTKHLQMPQLMIQQLAGRESRLHLQIQKNLALMLR